MLFICHKKALDQEQKLAKKCKPPMHKVLQIKVPIICMLGGPGSGKSTQCNNIVNKYNFTYLNTGNILQEEIDTGSDGGKMIAKTITEGGHIPDYIVLGLLFNGIVKHVHQSVGFIIDGFPRNANQGYEFEKKIGELDCIFYLICSTETMLKRISYGKKHETNGFDDIANIKKRIGFYKERMDTISSKFSTKLQEINDEKSVDAVFADIDKIIKDILLSTKFNGKSDNENK